MHALMSIVLWATTALLVRRSRRCAPQGSSFLSARVCACFVRGESEITRKTKGTGIGLALVVGLVAEMKGVCTLSNRREGGLQVELRVPRADCDR